MAVTRRAHGVDRDALRIAVQLSPGVLPLAMSPTLVSLAQKRELSLAEVASLTGGKLAGGAAPDRKVEGFTTLDTASENHLSFVANPKYAEVALNSKAAAVFVPEGLAVPEALARIEVRDVWGAIIKMMNAFCPPARAAAGIHPAAVVDGTAVVPPDASIGACAVVEAHVKLGAGVVIGANCYVGPHAVIGDGTVLHPGVKVLTGVEIGKRVIIHPGAVLGADGFKFELIGGRIQKVPQLGTVIVEDDVEIGANTTIDRASLAETRIGTRTKIDNQVQIAHNVTIGSDCLIVSQVGIAGSTKVGRGCVFGGQVGVADNIKITDGVRMGARSAISQSIDKPGDYLGAPALPSKQGVRVLLTLNRLPDLVKDVRELRSQVEALKKK